MLPLSGSGLHSAQTSSSALLLEVAVNAVGGQSSISRPSPTEHRPMDQYARPDFHSVIDTLGQALSDNSNLRQAPPHIVAKGKTIKQLTMIPFTDERVDIMAHRIGKTIYLDHMHIQSSKNESPSQRASPIYYNQSSMSTLVPTNQISADAWGPRSKKKNNPNIWDAVNAVSLYNTNPPSQEPPSNRPRSLSYKITSENGPSGHLWEFSNLRLLVEHDIPVIGGEDMPAICIRREDEKPISILSGMDMWLDQMIKGLDGVVVVRHEKDVFVEYNVHMSAEVPDLKGSEFDPNDLSRVISNVYRFLDDKMTQQGHTYYLHRGTGSSEITLYDLTALNPDRMGNAETNPYLSIVSCALLRQASDLLNGKDQSCNPELGAIEVAYKLITSSLKVFKPDQLPHLASSAYYLLASTYQFIPSLLTNGTSTVSIAGQSVCGLESLLIERSAEISGEVPISALLSVAAVLDEPGLPMAYRCCVPGISSILQSQECALDHIENALTYLSKVSDQRAGGSNQSRVVLFPIGPDDTHCADQVKRKPRPGSDTDFLRSVLCLRAAVSYVVICRERTDDATSDLSETVRKAIVLFSAKKGLRACADVIRLQSSGPLRAAAYIQCANLLPRLLKPIVESVKMTRDDLSNANSEGLFERKLLDSISIPESSAIHPIMHVSADLILSEKRADEWLLSACKKFTSLFAKCIQNSKDVKSKVYFAGYHEDQAVLIFGYLLLSAGDRCRDRTANLAREDSQILVHTSQALRYYEETIKNIQHMTKLVQTNYHQHLSAISCYAKHNTASVKRGNLSHYMYVEKQGTGHSKGRKFFEKAAAEVIAVYRELYDALTFLDNEDERNERLITTQIDMISFYEMTFHFLVERKLQPKDGAGTSYEECQVVDQAFAVFKHLLTMEPPQAKVTMAACHLTSMLATEICIMFNRKVLKTGDEADRTWQARLKLTERLFEVACKVNDVSLINMSLISQVIDTYFAVINADVNDLRRQVFCLHFLVNIPSNLQFSESAESSQSLERVYALCTHILLHWLKEKPHAKLRDATTQDALKKMANVLMRRSKPGDDSWANDTCILLNSLRNLWSLNDWIPKGN